MARVTVEDCIDKVPNRFDLVLLAAHRARAINAGSAPLVLRDNEKSPVLALREIASNVVSPERLTEASIERFQRHLEVDSPDPAFASGVLSSASSQERETPDEIVNEEELLQLLSITPERRG